MRRHVATTATALLVIALAGCTGGAEPTPTGTASTPDPTPSHQVWTAEDLADALLGEGTPDDVGEPVVTATGTVTHLSAHAVEMQVLPIDATERVTTLRYLLRTTDGSQVSGPGPLWTGTSRGDDTRAIALVDESAGEKLLPYTAWTLLSENGAPPLDISCACSDFPYVLDDRAVPMSAIFPPLSPGTDEVVVEFPDAAPVTVPVSWS